MMMNYGVIRTTLDLEMAREQIRHPRCAIIPSPDKLSTSGSSPGLDAIYTQHDFNDVWRWAREAGMLNTGFFEDVVDIGRGQLEKTVYDRLINFAFGSAFAPIRNTFFPAAEEMVLLYYTGHGISPRKARQLNRANPPNGQSSSPRLGLTNPFQYFPDRNVKGGELYLHDHIGYCDLMSLLTPWIAAVRGESNNVRGRVKRNKHLVVIADSCYSGILVQDLEWLKNMRGPWNDGSGCTVTVQSACSSNETTYARYFTPVFLHLNKTPQVLQRLKMKWSRMSPDAKNVWRQDGSRPSPQVATTRQFNPHDPTMVVSHRRDFKLTLFRDPGFFKFCAHRYRFLRPRICRRCSRG